MTEKVLFFNGKLTDWKAMNTYTFCPNKATSRPKTAAVATGETRNHRTWFQNQDLPLISYMDFVQSFSLPVFKWGSSIGRNNGRNVCESAWLTGCKCLIVHRSRGQNDVQSHLGLITYTCVSMRNSPDLLTFLSFVSLCVKWRQ